MSQKITNISETAPKTSKFAEKLNKLKPSAMDDEKKATVIGRIKITAAFAAGALSTVAVVAAKSYFNNLDEAAEEAKDELREIVDGSDETND